jgi:hypothetical protein
LGQVGQLTTQVSKLTDIVQAQDHKIRDMGAKLAAYEMVEEDGNPSGNVRSRISHMHSHIESKVESIEKIATLGNAGVKVEIQHLYDNLRKLTLQLNDLSVEVSNSATKEDIIEIMKSKAPVNEMFDLANLVSSKVSQPDLLLAVNKQMVPFSATLASVERSLRDIERSNAMIQGEFDALCDPKSYRNQAYGGEIHSSGVGKKAAWVEEPVTDGSNLVKLAALRNGLVQDVLREKNIDEIRSSNIEKQLKQQKDFLLREIQSVAQTANIECSSIAVDKVSVLRGEFDARVLELDSDIHECKALNERTKQGVKELAENVATALNGKADVAPSQVVANNGGGPGEDFTFQTAGALHNVSSSGGSAPAEALLALQRLTLLEDKLESSIAGLEVQHGKSKEIQEQIAMLATELQITKELATDLSGNVGPRAHGRPLEGNENVNWLQNLRESNKSSSSGDGVSALWRKPMGELSLSVRKELQEKCSREELYSAVSLAFNELHKHQTGLDTKLNAQTDGINSMKEEINVLYDSTYMSNARWLWTSGRQEPEEDWIIWDMEAQNSSPESLVWKPDESAILVTVPGLYIVETSFFTNEAICLQICLNGEPLYSITPALESVGRRGRGTLVDSHKIERVNHPAGEVTSFGVSEFISGEEIYFFSSFSLRLPFVIGFSLKFSNLYFRSSRRLEDFRSSENWWGQNYSRIFSSKKAVDNLFIIIISK